MAPKLLQTFNVKVFRFLVRVTYCIYTAVILCINKYFLKQKQKWYSPKMDHFDWSLEILWNYWNHTSSEVMEYKKENKNSKYNSRLVP